MDAFIAKNTPIGTRRLVVWLLFPGFLLIALFACVVRSVFGEPYPGPFMPAFTGNGLAMVSATQAELVMPKFTVTFADHTTAEISLNQLFADGPPSSHQGMLYQIAPNPNTPQPPTGVKKTLRDWLTRHAPWYHEPEINTAWTIHDDVRAYLHRRLVTLFPTKVPASLTIAMNKCYFPVEDFHNIHSVLDSEKTITFNEGI